MSSLKKEVQTQMVSGSWFPSYTEEEQKFQVTWQGWSETQREEWSEKQRVEREAQFISQHRVGDMTFEDARDHLIKTCEEKSIAVDEVHTAFWGKDVGTTLVEVLNKYLDGNKDKNTLENIYNNLINNEKWHQKLKEDGMKAYAELQEIKNETTRMIVLGRMLEQEDCC